MDTINGIPVNGYHAVESVLAFNRIGQSVPPGKHFNADRVGFHIGMQCEELAETLKAVAGGAVSPREREAVMHVVTTLDTMGKSLKAGNHMGSVLRANREELLDGAIDVLVVTLGSMMYQTPAFVEAIGEVLKANAFKFPDGVATRDANGKIMKPAGWQPPNLALYVDHPPAD